MTREEATLRAERLSRREREVLQALADGLSAREVARRLFIDTRTVHTHLRHCYRKLEAHSNVQAVVAGIKAGVVRL